MSETMRFLKKEDFPELLPAIRRRETTLRAMLLQAQVGEGVYLPFSKWKSKSKPGYVVWYLKKTKGLLFEYGLHTDGTGWVFRRVA